MRQRVAASMRMGIGLGGIGLGGVGLAVMIALLAAAFSLGTAVAADSANPAAETHQKRLQQGKDLVDSICFWCHEPELMVTKHLSKAEWAGLIRGMIREGAPVTDDEFDMITDYLSAKFGPVEE